MVFNVSKLSLFEKILIFRHSHVQATVPAVCAHFLPSLPTSDFSMLVHSRTWSFSRHLMRLYLRSPSCIRQNQTLTRVVSVVR
jgi:hypothetical protein